MLGVVHASHVCLACFVHGSHIVHSLLLKPTCQHQPQQNSLKTLLIEKVLLTVPCCDSLQQNHRMMHFVLNRVGNLRFWSQTTQGFAGPGCTSVSLDLALPPPPPPWCCSPRHWTVTFINLSYSFLSFASD